jgi:DNA-directed RNA polymerase subunit RPC12/RpoP
MSDIIYCTHCGTGLSKAAKFCQNCGKPINDNRKGANEVSGTISPSTASRQVQCPKCRGFKVKNISSATGCFSELSAASGIAVCVSGLGLTAIGAFLGAPQFGLIVLGVGVILFLIAWITDQPPASFECEICGYRWQNRGAKA